MTQNGWHTIREEACTTVARRLPVRFDVSVSAQFPTVSKTRLAQQIRQDMWRSLQNVRGFLPIVRVEEDTQGLKVTAGGQMPRPIAANIELKIENLLNDAPRRARWIACASKRQVAI